MTSESNMAKIIEDLKCKKEAGRNDKTRWLNTKIGWQNYLEYSPNPITQILDVIKSNTNYSEWSYKEPIHDANRMTIKSDVVQNMGKKGEQNREVYVERYIAQHDENMCNQWCVGANSKESIDLIYKNNDHTYTLIELKVSGLEDNGKYTPPFALIEIIKNYYLAQKFNKNVKIKELAILSTKNFYAKFADDKSSIEKFLQDKKLLSSKLNLPINFYYLNIDESVLVENLKNNKKIPEISKDNWKTIETLQNWQDTK